MWETNKDITHLYVTNGGQQSWAIFSGLSGWKRVRPGSPDGVTNVTQVLSEAKTRGRKVNVFLNTSNQIERALML